MANGGGVVQPLALSTIVMWVASSIAVSTGVALWLVTNHDSRPKHANAVSHAQFRQFEKSQLEFRHEIKQELRDIKGLLIRKNFHE